METSICLIYPSFKIPVPANSTFLSEECSCLFTPSDTSYKIYEVLWMEAQTCRHLFPPSSMQFESRPSLTGIVGICFLRNKTHTLTSGYKKIYFFFPCTIAININHTHQAPPNPVCMTNDSFVFLLFSKDNTWPGYFPNWQMYLPFCSFIVMLDEHCSYFC